MRKDSLISPYEGKFSTILLFGPPGVGKGTLGKFLSGAGTQYHLSSGDIFRSLPSYSPAGKLFYSYASRGLLIPDETTVEIWKYYVHGLIATNAYYPESQDLLLDGLPRTRQQAEMLSHFINVKHVIVLEVSDTKELRLRLEKRARKEGRLEEMQEECIQKRLTSYEESIHSILEFYPKHLISSVDAGQRPLEVLRDVLVRLSHLLSRAPQQ